MTSAGNKILYLFPFESSSDTDFSIFQGFSNGLLEFASAMWSITRMPSSTVEFTATKQQLRRLRVLGSSSYLVIPIEVDLLPAVDLSSTHPVCVVFSSEATVERVASWCSSIRPSPLHVSSVASERALPLSQFTRTRLRRHVLATLDALGLSGLGANITSAREALRRRTTLPFPRTWHNTCTPNENTLFSIGFGFTHTQHIVPPVADFNGPYVQSILRTASKTLNIRDAVDRSIIETPSLILTTPGLDRDSIRRALRGKGLRGPEFSDLRSWLQSMRDQTHYVPQLEVEALERLFTNENAAPARHLVSLRTGELDLYTAGLSIRAASELSAVVRLPPVGPLLLDAARKLGDCYRGQAARRTPKLRTCVADLGRALRDHIPDAIWPLVKRQHTGIRVVSDAPLEWLPSEHGLPLSLTHDVSRIMCTPGNVLLGQLLPGRSVLVGPSTFNELLLLRSFRDGDPIKPLMATALEHYAEAIGSHFHIATVDVSTPDEFVNAINSYNGVWMIFEGLQGIVWVDRPPYGGPLTG